MAIDWFYADLHNQQQGPVDKAWLAEAYGSGSVRADTLVWREGLSGWVPLRQVGAQIGLVIVGGAPPVPARAARSSAGIAAKPTSSSSWVLVLVLVVIALVVIIAILAAIAVPAYNDYLWRAKVSQALVQGAALKQDVAAFHESENHCPTNGEGGISVATVYATPTVASIEVGPLESGGDCAITITLVDTAPRAIAGKHVQFVLNEDGQWRTNSDLPAKFLPPSLRDASSH